ncbi:2'-5' RNA ligase family protein [Hypericibacter sp.]|uniref:2'-5' RNA ligase family protein n=1 Tax=Hypericibacter sp. TaxID=2705401 RepID=UPI003D6D6AC3
MSRQSDLFDGDRTPQPTDRLFFAIYPDSAAATQIAHLAKHLRDEHELKGAPLALDRFHVTLHHLGDHEGLPPTLVAAAQEAGAAISESTFDAAFDYVASFRTSARNRPFVLRGSKGLAPLMAFQQAIGMAMKKAGLGRWVQPQFTPHVTLLYDDHLVGEQTVEQVSWTVREFVLVHSLLGRTQHIPLGRWSLRG